MQSNGKNSSKYLRNKWEVIKRGRNKLKRQNIIIMELQSVANMLNKRTEHPQSES